MKFLFRGRLLTWMDWDFPFIHFRKGHRMKEIQHGEMGLVSTIPFNSKIPDGWHDYTIFKKEE